MSKKTRNICIPMCVKVKNSIITSHIIFFKSMVESTYYGSEMHYSVNIYTQAEQKQRLLVIKYMPL